MLTLARLLIVERCRRQGAQFGWHGFASMALAFGLIGWAAVSAIFRFVPRATPAQVQAILNAVWAGWVLLGILVGKDLGWQIRLERITIFPAAGFRRIYLLASLLWFLSLPLGVALILFGFAASAIAGFSLTVLPAALAAFGMFALTARFPASVIRAAIYGRRFLPRTLEVAVALGSLPVAACAVGAIWYPPLGTLLPGHQLALVLLPERSYAALFRLAAAAVLLAGTGFAVERRVVYSGVRGPMSRRGAFLSGARRLLLYPAWPGEVFRISVLGWLRSRNAVLLWVWGVLYGFLYTYFTRPGEPSYFFAFTFMMMVFHSYLRGNLLGVDASGTWLYYAIPAPVENALRAKNRSLSLLQASMMAAVLVPGLLRAGPGMTADVWGRIFSFCVSGLLAGEILGIYFSLRHPEPIERTSMYSGGMTPGALGVPIAQVVFLLTFLLASALVHHFLPSALFWGFLLLVPAALWIACAMFLRGWAHNTMLSERERLLQSLTAFTS